MIGLRVLQLTAIVAEPNVFNFSYAGLAEGEVQSMWYAPLSLFSVESLPLATLLNAICSACIAAGTIIRTWRCSLSKLISGFLSDGLSPCHVT